MDIDLIEDHPNEIGSLSDQSAPILTDLVNDCLYCIFEFSDTLDKFFMSMTCKKFTYLKPKTLYDISTVRPGQRYYTPVHTAAEKGYINLVKLFFTNHKPTISILLDAIHGGNIEIILYLESLKLDPETHDISECLYVAALKENLSIFIHYFNNYTQYQTSKLSNMRKLYSILGKAGNLVVLKWFHNSYLHSAEFKIPQTVQAISSGAARKGKLNVLKWLLNCKYNLPGALLYNEAIRGNSLPTLLWLQEHSIKGPKRLFDIAASMGQVDIMKYLVKQGYSLDSDVCWLAARHGQLHVLKWLYEQGCIGDERVLIEARKKGHTNIINWFVEN